MPLCDDRVSHLRESICRTRRRARRYILKVVPDPEREKALGAMQAHLDDEGRERVFSIADALKQEGREEGREEGRAEGRTEGRVAGAAEVVLAVLESRFAVSQSVRDRVLACRDMEIFERWARRAALVATAEELFEA